MRRQLTAILAGLLLLGAGITETKACTGITLKTPDGKPVLARTIEWGGSDQQPIRHRPRGYRQQSYVPGGVDGMKFEARYGYVGLAVEQKEFVAEGVNEKGLSAGLFYFPNYGSYETYAPAKKDSSIADLQLVSWILGVARPWTKCRQPSPKCTSSPLTRVHRPSTGASPTVGPASGAGNHRRDAPLL